MSKILSDKAYKEIQINCVKCEKDVTNYFYEERSTVCSVCFKKLMLSKDLKKEFLAIDIFAFSIKQIDFILKVAKIAKKAKEVK